MTKTSLLIMLMLFAGADMADNRRDIRDGTGRLLGWVITLPSGTEKVYHVSEGLKGWYNPNNNRTYRVSEGLYAIGNRLDNLIND